MQLCSYAANDRPGMGTVSLFQESILAQSDRTNNKPAHSSANSCNWQFARNRVFD